MAVLLPIIDGRECVPVRWLPFVNDWEWLSPDVVARLFARDHPWHKWSLSAFKVNHDGTYEQVPPQSWNNVVVELETLALLDLKRRQQQRSAQLSPAELEWRRRSIERLPAGVFVWKEELEAEFTRTAARTRLWARTGFRGGGIGELTYTLLLSSETAKVASQGFGALFPHPRDASPAEDKAHRLPTPSDAAPVSPAKMMQAAALYSLVDG